MHNDIECMLCLLLTGIFILILWSISVRSIISMYEVIFQINWVNFYMILLMYFYDLPNRIHLVLTCRCTRHCCSHAFSETNSLRRTMQIVEYSLLHGGPKAESPLSQGPWPVFVKTLHTLSVSAQTHLPKFSETSLNNGKERYNQS